MLLDRFSFTGNVDKIRKALLDYFKREGVKCEIKDGSVAFEFDDYVYEVNFVIHDNYAECVKCSKLLIRFMKIWNWM